MAGEKMVRVLALVRVHGAGYRAPRLNVRIGVIVGPSQPGFDRSNELMHFIHVAALRVLFPDG